MAIATNVAFRSDAGVTMSRSRMLRSVSYAAGRDERLHRVVGEHAAAAAQKGLLRQWLVAGNDSAIPSAT
jgi:hypothetical protein